jgi:hypothetical protein
MEQIIFDSRLDLHHTPPDSVLPTPDHCLQRVRGQRHLWRYRLQGLLMPCSPAQRKSAALKDQANEKTDSSHQRWSKSSFSIALICNTRRRIPVSASTNQGPGRGDVMPL